MLSKLVDKLPPWLDTKTDVPKRNNGIVVSTRIRLARNIARYPFPNRCTDNDKKAVRKSVQQAAAEVWKEHTAGFIDIEKLEALDRLFLLERQLISKELAEADTKRSAFIAEDESFCVMINEEDHLRIHSLTAGDTLDGTLESALENVWQTVNTVDNQLEGQLDYVFDSRYGYLTSCPTNAGTGMRVSVMLHLPALVATKEMDNVFRSLQKVYLTVRGLYGEGTQAFGELFQISNQITLGKSEADIIGTMLEAVPQIIEHERKAREYLLSEKTAQIQDRCCRALGLLQTACVMESIETMNHLSSVRLGISTGILTGIGIDKINRLLLHTQPAHLQKITGRILEQPDRDIERSKLLRLTLKGH
ncbi:MAG: protein arginine kinase [Planctomycetaceae bacterium]|jgi:protein arginine kinase|nr:protein arginine kinase [Planctomycetaceae bacterium]